MWKRAMLPSQATMTSTKTTRAGAHSPALRPTAFTDSSSSGNKCSPRSRSNSRTSVTSSKKRGASRVSTPRGLGRSISTIPAIRPGRGLITTTRDERNTASEIECVTKTTVEARRSQIESSSRLRRSRVISSSAPNGSSINRSAGSNARARAIDARCCMPPESCQGWWSPKPLSSTRSSISATRALRRSFCQPSISSGSEMFFATVRQSKRTASWNTIP